MKMKAKRILDIAAFALCASVSANSYAVDLYGYTVTDSDAVIDRDVKVTSIGTNDTLYGVYGENVTLNNGISAEYTVNVDGRNSAYGVFLTGPTSSGYIDLGTIASDITVKSDIGNAEGIRLSGFNLTYMGRTQNITSKIDVSGGKSAIGLSFINANWHSIAIEGPVNVRRANSTSDAESYVAGIMTNNSCYIYSRGAINVEWDGQGSNVAVAGVYSSGVLRFFMQEGSSIRVAGGSTAYGLTSNGDMSLTGNANSVSVISTDYGVIKAAGDGAALDIRNGHFKFRMNEGSNAAYLHIFANSGVLIEDTATIDLDQILLVQSAGSVNIKGDIIMHADSLTGHMLRVLALDLTIEDSASFTYILEDGFSALENDTMAVINASTIVSSFTDDNFEIVTNDGTVLVAGTDYTFDGTHVTFLKDIAVVPEPAEVAAVLGALAIVMAAYRRRK